MRGRHGRQRGSDGARGANTVRFGLRHCILQIAARVALLAVMKIGWCHGVGECNAASGLAAKFATRRCRCRGLIQRLRAKIRTREVHARLKSSNLALFLLRRLSVVLIQIRPAVDGPRVLRRCAIFALEVAAVLCVKRETVG